MNISYLKEFIILSQYKNYTAAANYLYITQPVLSRHIATLEKNINVKLFNRSTRYVELTTEGEIFLESALVIIQQYDLALKKLNQLKSTDKTIVNIGFLNGTINKYLTKIALLLQVKYENVKINFISYDFKDISKALEFDEVDMIVTLNFNSNSNNDIKYYPLLNELLSCVLPPNHRLVNHKNINIHDLSHENIILPIDEHFNEYKDFILRIFNRSDISPTINPIALQVQTASLEIEMGNGIAIIPLHVNYFVHEKLNINRIVDADQYIGIGIEIKSRKLNSLHNKIAKTIQSVVNPACND